MNPLENRYLELVDLLKHTDQNLRYIRNHSNNINEFCDYLSTFTSIIENNQTMYVDSQNNIYSLNEIKNKFLNK